MVATYFDGSDYDNLYKIALERCLSVADFVVAVIPETFLLSSFDKSRLALVSVIEGDLFSRHRGTQRWLPALDQKKSSTTLVFTTATNALVHSKKFLICATVAHAQEYKLFSMIRTDA